MSRMLILLGFLYCTVLTGQTARQLGPLIPVHKLHEDLGVLKSQLEMVHAGLYAYTSKEEMNSVFEKIKAQINQPLTDIDFYRRVAPIQQKIRNGHSMIVPSERWDDMKEKELPLFPFDVYWGDEKLYVLRNLSNDESIAPGSLIQKINGESATDVFNQLIDHWTSDGYNRTYPAKHITSDFPNFYANIKGAPLTFEIEIESLDGAKRTLQVKALLTKTLNAFSISRYDRKRVPWYLEGSEDRLSLKILGESALLTVPTFDSSSKGTDGKKYHKFYEKTFRKIRMAEVKHLVLDLRGNGGGDPKPQLALLANLIDKPIVMYKKVYAVTNAVSQPELYGSEGASLNKQLGRFLEKDGAVYGLNELAKKRFGVTWEPTMPTEDVFKGNLYVLTDGYSFSATGEVAGMLKTHRKDAIFIGEETGGNPTQNTSGVMVFMNLPNSKVRVMQSLICFETNVDFENDGHGAKPDHPLKNTIEQELRGEDAVLKWTMNLIRTSKKEE